MTLKELATKLDKHTKYNEIICGEDTLAEQNGYVILYCNYDDKMVFRGALFGEVNCLDSIVVYITTDSILTEYQDGSKTINTTWFNEQNDYVWSFETEIPHETFDIYDYEGNKWCKGIVFDMNSI